MLSNPKETSTQDIIRLTQGWVSNAVIGLNLCPFAKAVYIKNQIRYVVSQAESVEALMKDLACELSSLNTADPAVVDTTLLIHPFALADFLEYNDFLETADSIVEELGLEGEIQIASFHPHYQFADSRADDIENYTNRSPYPMLHLLRESSIDQAASAFPDASDIFEKNMETLRQLGHKGWQDLETTFISPSLEPKNPD